RAVNGPRRSGARQFPAGSTTPGASPHPGQRTAGDPFGTIKIISAKDRATGVERGICANTRHRQGPQPHGDTATQDPQQARSRPDWSVQSASGPNRPLAPEHTRSTQPSTVDMKIALI